MYALCKVCIPLSVTYIGLNCVLYSISTSWTLVLCLSGYQTLCLCGPQQTHYTFKNSLSRHLEIRGISNWHLFR